MMQCLQLTRGDAPKKEVTVTLAGEFNSNYGYVTIDGTKYTKGTTVQALQGTLITVGAGGAAKWGSIAATIELNGTTVVEAGSNDETITYEFAVSDNCKITISRGSGLDSDVYSATITMPA